MSGKKRSRNINRLGRWAGMTSRKIAGLLGCSVSTAKRELKKLGDISQFSLEEQEDIIGKLIYDYRFRKEIPLIMKLTKNIKPF